MVIHEFFYEEDIKRLYVEFSTDKDQDRVYRILDLDYDDIAYYSPYILEEEDLLDVDESFVIDIIEQYVTENELPPEIIL